MSWLSKLGRRAIRGARRLVKPALRAAAASVTGGLSEAAVRVAKGIGAHRPARVPKIQPLSVRAVIAKTQVRAPGRLKGMPAATTMPGGAPLTTGRKAKRRYNAATDGIAKRGPQKGGRFRGPFTRRTGKTLKRALQRKHGLPSLAKRSGRAPSGGKDFKALSASWKAAGKPGTWLDWVKSH